MSLKEFIGRASYLGRRSRFDQELADEIRFHIESRTAELEQSGLSAGEARTQAQREFGNRTSTQETVRETRGFQIADWMGQDLRYALRRLRMNPGFALCAVLSLALGIGANTAIFQLLNAVRLRSLPVRNPQELVQVSMAGGSSQFGVTMGEFEAVSFPVWKQIRDHQESFSGAFAWAFEESPLGTGNARRNVRGALVSGQTFPTLGVTATRGRVLEPEDDVDGCGNRVAVVSYGFWQREFGGLDPAIGSRIMIHDVPFTLVGVTPPGFFGIEIGKTFDVALPLCTAETWRKDLLLRSDVSWMTVLGRLKPGWTKDRTARYLESVSAAWFEAVAPGGYDPANMDVWRRLRLTAAASANGISGLRKYYEVSLWLLLGITGLVLAITCANLANLVLARSLAGSREIAVRMAVGASRFRVVCQLLMESLLIGCSAGILGVGLAVVVSRSVVRFLSTRLYRIDLDLSLDAKVLAYTVGVALLTSIGFGLATALPATRDRALPALGSGIRGSTNDPKHFFFQRILVVVQIAICLVLLVSSVLFVRSFRNLFAVNPGFRQEGIAVSVAGFGTLKLSRESRETLQREIIERVRRIPGVESASTSTAVPVGNWAWALNVRKPGGGKEQLVFFSWVRPQYFSTMEIPILSGRDISELDRPSSPRALVVNETFVRQVLNGGPAVGKTVRNLAEPGYPETPYEIVGVVRDAKYSDLWEEQRSIAYAPELQNPFDDQGMNILTRSALPVTSLSKSIRDAVQQVNPEIPMQPSLSLRAEVLERLSRERLLAWLSAFFAALAVVLAAIGLYGVVSYMVTGRRNEIGIRLALGSTRRGVVWLVLRQIVKLVVAGLVIGIPGSIAVSRAARALLYGLGPDDLPSLVTSAVAVVLVVLCASVLSAQRAARLDPSSALRCE